MKLLLNYWTCSKNPLVSILFGDTHIGNKWLKKKKNDVNKTQESVNLFKYLN